MSEKENVKSTGRSMIEMLGVLAIIGVLSIGGLAGYKIAMNYHRANETIHDVMLRATNVPMKWDDYANKTENFEFTFADMGAYKNNNAVGYEVHTYAEPETSAYLYRVEVSNVPSEVCKRINNMNPVAVDKIEPASANCEVESGILDKMTFYFDENFGSNEDGVNPNPSPDNPSQPDNPENPDVPDTPEDPDTPSNVCEEGCAEGTYCSNGVCVECPAVQESCVNSDAYDASTLCQTYKNIACEGNTYCNTETDKCVECSAPQESCVNSDTYDENTHCQTYKKIVCEGNTYCNTETGACVSCEEPNQLNDSKTKCCEKKDYCTSYGENCECLMCETGYTANSAGTCCPNIAGCSGYNDSCGCSACETGYTANSAGTCCPNIDPPSNMAVVHPLDGCPYLACKDEEVMCSSYCCPKGTSCGTNSRECCLDGDCFEICSGQVGFSFEKTPVFCRKGSESWCCPLGNTCGDEPGQCCQDGKCCPEGESVFDLDGSKQCCSVAEYQYDEDAGFGWWVCCHGNETIYSAPIDSTAMARITDGVPVYEEPYRFQDYCCTNDPNISFERDEGFVLNGVPNGLLYGPVCCKSGTYFAWDDLTSFVGRCLAD